MLETITASDTLLAAAMLLFVAGFVAVEGIWLWWQSNRGADARRIADRVRDVTDGPGSASRSDTLLRRRAPVMASWLERSARLLPTGGTLDDLLVQSGSEQTAQSFATLCAGVFAATTLASLALGFPAPWALALGVVAAITPPQYLVHKRAKRLQHLEAQLPEALDLIGRALRAGHSLSSAIQAAGEELPEPIGREFRQVFDEINYGVATQVALENLARRVPSVDVGFFVVSVLIQRETGGNLAEVLDNISGIVRDRLTLFGKVKALSAEGRFSGLVLAMLPFATATLLYLAQPDFMSVLWIEPLGRLMIAVGAVLMVLGGLWMRKIVRIRV
jgi:tight adherence protein B